MSVYLMGILILKNHNNEFPNNKNMKKECETTGQYFDFIYFYFQIQCRLYNKYFVCCFIFCAKSNE
jgi:hypothetical protein